MTATTLHATSLRGVLTRAAAEISSRGLAKGDFITDAGCCCVIGALRLAAGGQVDDSRHVDRPRPADTYAAACAALLTSLGHIGLLPPSIEAVETILERWNDAPDRRARDVVSALITAAASGP